MHFKPFALLAAGALAALIATGCSKGSDQSSTSTTTTAESSPAASATTGTSSTDTSSSSSAAPAAAPGGTAMGDPAHGKTIFAANCASCHGATGHEGGVGPSLANEKSKKNYQATIAWIHNPQPPMPKLWPSPLNDKDVQDVAAYVQSL
jgi:mono/diheme cytochrome c family protein